MPYFYQTGEQILEGDRVLLHGNPGEIETIADPAENASEWLAKQFGGGVMVLEPKVFGRVFLTASEHAGLQLVSRKPV